MADKHFIVATAGHVDHGKSALVRALTGIAPDRLPEEKARGITIELGFAQLAVPAPAPSDDIFHLGLIDVPGHEDFVKNMVAGVGSVDVALLIVAADDGWMPQTEEHLQILTFLGVRRAVVALTKIDRAQSPSAAQERVREKLRASPFEHAPIILTSTRTGQGFEALKAALSRLLADAPPPRDFGKPRLPIDRVFSLRGVGTVVTGTLTGGTIPRGSMVVAQPSGRTGRVRTMQNHGREVETALPGTRTALGLPDFETTGPGAVARGEVVVSPDAGGSSHALDVLLTRSARNVPGGVDHLKDAAARQPVKDGTHVRVHLGTGAWTVRVRLLDRRTDPPGSHVIARLRFDAPVFAFAGERLIVRDGAERSTLAGGVVLDPVPTRRPLRRPAQRRFLERLAAAGPADLLEIAAAWLERDHAILRSALLRRSLHGGDEIAAAVDALTVKGEAVTAGDWVADAAWWKMRLQDAADRITAWHREHPEQIGLPLGHLRREIERLLPGPTVFDALVDGLVAKAQFIRAGTAIRHASHLPTLPPHLRTAGDRLRAVLAGKPFEPPSRKELAPDAAARQALRYLCDTGEALELGDDLILSQDGYQRMKTIVARTLRSAGPSTAGELRQVLGTTRRIIIPLLEALDRDGVTQRVGDRRTLR